MNLSYYFKHGLTFILILGSSILLGTLFIIGVYFLPVSPMKENVARSSAIFDYEGVYPQLVQGYKSSQLDNCTDAIMLGTAIYPGKGEGYIERAILGERIEYNSENPVQSLNDYVNNVAGKAELEQISGYARYWHGYLLFLKPLLIFFDYGDIRYLNMFLQFIILTWLCLIIISKNRQRMMIPFICFFFVLKPMVLMLSLQYTSVYYIMLISVIIILKKDDWLVSKKGGYFLLFEIIGMATSYFDFLTYPAITLGIPLTIAILLDSRNKVDGKIFKVIKLSLSWGLGYAGMWCGKWLVSSILLHRNFFADAIEQIFLRTSMETEGQSISWFMVVWRNLKVILKWPYLILAGIIFIWFTVAIFKYGINFGKREMFLDLIPYLIIAAIPLGWYLAMGNHSYEHYWYTYRELGISCFAVLAWAVQVPCKMLGHRIA